jgi:hypothetical protein
VSDLGVAHGDLRAVQRANDGANARGRSEGDKGAGSVLVLLLRGLGFATHGCDVASDSVVAVTVPCVAVTVPCVVGPEFQAVSMKEHCGCLLDCLVLDVSEPEVIVAYRASAAPLTTPGDDGSGHSARKCAGIEEQAQAQSDCVSCGWRVAATPDGAPDPAAH